MPNRTPQLARIEAARGPDDLVSAYRHLRAESAALAAPLSAEDQVVQSMADASPTKWHLAHTTWFFETFLLEPYLPGYRLFDPRYGFLFNSYYEALGARHPRPDRGLLTRPAVGEIAAYRAHVDAAMDELMTGTDDATRAHIAPLLALGIAHEQQHQELLLTDILSVLARNPLRPAYSAPEPATAGGAALNATPPSASFVAFAGGIHEIGYAGNGFAFDNEGPRHKVYLCPFALANLPVTNGQWRAFMADGGYSRAELWLADGWAIVQSEGWHAPLYWERDGDRREWLQMGLRGLRPIDAAAPVCHISFYEADAFARWAGKRLPSEAEWEIAASQLAPRGNTRGSGLLESVAAEVPNAGDGDGNGLRQMFGDVWEWTASAYAPYPGFRPAAGAVGEYNGKFMCNQMVLRGGSCATADGHARASYRNFFYPHQRWQFTGLRLAEDV